MPERRSLAPASSVFRRTRQSSCKRPGAPRATPLGWDELPRLRAADQFRFANIGRRLRQLKADPWADIDRLQQTLPARRR